MAENSKTEVIAKGRGSWMTEKWGIWEYAQKRVSVDSDSGERRESEVMVPLGIQFTDDEGKLHRMPFGAIHELVDC